MSNALIKKAKAYKPQTTTKVVDKEVYDLVLAVLNGEISQTQASVALGGNKKSPSNQFYSIAWRVFKKYYEKHPPQRPSQDGFND